MLSVGGSARLAILAHGCRNGSKRIALSCKEGVYYYVCWLGPLKIVIVYNRRRHFVSYTARRSICPEMDFGSWSRNKTWLSPRVKFGEPAHNLIVCFLSMAYPRLVHHGIWGRHTHSSEKDPVILYYQLSCFYTIKAVHMVKVRS